MLNCVGFDVQSCYKEIIINHNVNGASQCKQYFTFLGIKLHVKQKGDVVDVKLKLCPSFRTAT